MIYVLDSDSVNFLIREHHQLQCRFRQALADIERFILSPIVHFEVTRYLDLKGAAKLRRRYDALIRDWEKAELIGGDWDRAAELWADLHDGLVDCHHCGQSRSDTRYSAMRVHWTFGIYLLPTPQSI
jgi:hypothetical protein